MAFTIEGFLDKETKLDPRYVKSFTRLYWLRDGELGQTMLKHHQCTPEEFARFAPPLPEAAGLLEVYRTSKTRSLFCIDWDEFGDVLGVWGSELDEFKY